MSCCYLFMGWRTVRTSNFRAEQTQVWWCVGLTLMRTCLRLFLVCSGMSPVTGIRIGLTFWRDSCMLSCSLSPTLRVRVWSTMCPTPHANFFGQGSKNRSHRFLWAFTPAWTRWAIIRCVAIGRLNFVSFPYASNNLQATDKRLDQNPAVVKTKSQLLPGHP